MDWKDMQKNELSAKYLQTYFTGQLSTKST